MTAAAIPTGSRRRLDIGRVLRGIGAFVTRHWLWLLVAGFLLAFLPEFLAALLLGYAARHHMLPTAGIAALGARNWIRALINLAPAGVLLTLIARRVVDETDPPGRIAPLAGLARAPMAIVTRILMILGISAGYLLLIVPGVLLSLAWAVAVPVAVAEGVRPTECLARSTDLTRNHRGAIFLLALIFGIVSVVFGLIVGALMGFTVGVLRPTSLTQTLSWVTPPVTAAVGAVAVTLNCVGVAIVYRELTQGRRDAAARDVARLFD